MATDGRKSNRWRLPREVWRLVPNRVDRPGSPTRQPAGPVHDARLLCRSLLPTTAVDYCGALAEDAAVHGKGVRTVRDPRGEVHHGSTCTGRACRVLALGAASPVSFHQRPMGPEDAGPWPGGSAKDQPPSKEAGALAICTQTMVAPPALMAACRACAGHAGVRTTRACILFTPISGVLEPRTARTGAPSSTPAY